MRVNEEDHILQDAPIENIDMINLNNRKIDSQSPKELVAPLLEKQDAEPQIVETGFRVNEREGTERDHYRPLLENINKSMKHSNRYLRFLAVNKITRVSDPAVEAGSEMKLIATTLNRICGIILTIINMATLCWMILVMAVPKNTAD